MDGELTDRQRACRQGARQFAAAEVAPWAGQIDREERTPESVLAAISSSGYLGASLPAAWGGREMDPTSYGLVLEELGKVCSSVRSLLTVHNMCAHALLQFGTPEQQKRWLPALCAGHQRIAFALSEPEVGSAAQTIQTQAVKRADGYLLNGTKKWVTYGLVAHLFVVFARSEAGPLALVVEREREGLQIEPVKELLGTRGSMVAQLRLHDVFVPADHQLGQAGMGLRFVANVALDHGRFSVAWGSTGIIQACLDACVSYAQERQQGESKLKDYQLIRRQLADMLVAHTAARALCYRSARLRELRHPRAAMETSLAKYHASASAMRVAADAVHMHGANGCSSDYPVARYLRDATVMGIIEGTHEIHQLSLANYAFQRPYIEG